ncbi:WD40 repeat domain-containing protein [Streptomyces sp. CA-251387]|uniref:WD40 repeat domain-containing protein n=1 Tax=Streptomyces sp. CA-251387 TaxID=3240064 RepID=UPI003D8A4DC0
MLPVESLTADTSPGPLENSPIAGKDVDGQTPQPVPHDDILEFPTSAEQASAGDPVATRRCGSLLLTITAAVVWFTNTASTDGSSANSGFDQPLAVLTTGGIGDTGFITDVAFSPDGKTLATASNGDRRTWLRDVATRKTITTLTASDERVGRMAFSPDGKTLATGGNNGMREGGTVQLWTLANGKSTATLTGHTEGVTGVAFSPDGKTLATASTVTAGRGCGTSLVIPTHPLRPPVRRPRQGADCHQQRRYPTNPRHPLVISDTRSGGSVPRGLLQWHSLSALRPVCWASAWRTTARTPRMPT